MDVLGEWFVCFANYIYPFLVLLEQPMYFLVGITIFTTVNLYFAYKQFRGNKNYFVLSTYPLLFHICFIIFYFATNNKVLVYT